MYTHMIGSIEKVDFVLAHRAIQTRGTAVTLRGAAACGDVGGVFTVKVGALSEGREGWGADANETSGDFRGAGHRLAGSLMERDVERECEGTYAHIWIMGWYHVTSGLLLTWIRTIVPTILKIGAL